MENIWGAFDAFDRASTVIVICAALVGIYQWCVGISPALWRLGKGLAGRKIAIFAEGDQYTSLKNLLIDSKLFNERNIAHITNNDLGRAESYGLFLVHWKSIASQLDKVLNKKKDGAALIIYAPREDGLIAENDLAKINQHRNVIVVNFRGRLLNDIVTSLITTSYEK